MGKTRTSLWVQWQNCYESWYVSFGSWKADFEYVYQGWARDQDVSVLKRTNVSSWSRLGHICQFLGLEKIGLVLSLGLETRPGILVYFVFCMIIIIPIHAIISQSHEICQRLCLRSQVKVSVSVSRNRSRSQFRSRDEARHFGVFCILYNHSHTNQCNH